MFYFMYFVSYTIYKFIPQMKRLANPTPNLAQGQVTRLTETVDCDYLSINRGLWLLIHAVNRHFYCGMDELLYPIEYYAVWLFFPCLNSTASISSKLCQRKSLRITSCDTMGQCSSLPCLARLQVRHTFAYMLILITKNLVNGFWFF